LRIEVGQWNQHEGALSQPRMGNGQFRFFKAVVAEQQDIQIQSPGAEWALRVAYPSLVGLDGQKGCEQSARRPGRSKSQGHDLIAIGRLVRIAPGFCRIDRTGDQSHDVRERGKALPGRLQMGQSVSQIGAQANMRGYSLAMRDKASSRRATGTVMAMRK